MKKTLISIIAASVLLTGCSTIKTETIGSVVGGITAGVIAKKSGASNGATALASIIGVGIGSTVGAYFDNIQKMKQELEYKSSLNIQLTNDKKAFKPIVIDSAYNIKTNPNVIRKKTLKDIEKTCNIARDNGGKASISVPYEWMISAMPDNCETTLNSNKNEKNIIVVLSK